MEKHFKIVNELVKQMNDIVAEKMTSFQSDFVCFDVPRITLNWGNFRKAYWFVRETGTNLLLFNDKELTEEEKSLIDFYMGFNKSCYTFECADGKLILEREN